MGAVDVSVVRGDLTKSTCDAVVNPANEEMRHGGGVAKQLVLAGGKVVQDESDAWVAQHGEVPTGSAATTSAGRMKANWIIHAVGPKGDDEQRAQLLMSAVASALDEAEAIGAKSVAMPVSSVARFFKKKSGKRDNRKKKEKKRNNKLTFVFS